MAHRKDDLIGLPAPRLAVLQWAGQAGVNLSEGIEERRGVVLRKERLARLNPTSTA